MNGFLLGVIYLLLVSMAITLFFTFFLKRRGPWGNFWAFFVIIFLSAFVTDIWIESMGPVIYNDIYWAPPLTVAFIIALLLAATTPSPKTKSELVQQKKAISENKDTIVSLGVFFWFLFALLLLLIIVGSYLNYY